MKLYDSSIELIRKFKEDNENKINSYVRDLTIPDDLNLLVPKMRNLREQYTELSKYIPTPINFNLTQQLELKRNEELKTLQNERVSCVDDYQNACIEREEEVSKANLAKKNAVDQKVKHSQSLQQELLSYKKDIDKYIYMYNIPIVEVDISNLSNNELDLKLTDAINTARKLTGNKTSKVNNLIDKVITLDFAYQIAILVTLLVLIYFFGWVFSIFFFGSLFYNLFRFYNMKTELSYLHSLMVAVNFDKYKEEVEVVVVKKEDLQNSLQTRTDAIDAKIDEVNAKYDQELQEYNSRLPKLNADYEATLAAINTYKNQTLEKLGKVIDDMAAKSKQLYDEYPAFGSRCNTRLSMNNTFCLETNKLGLDQFKPYEIINTGMDMTKPENLSYLNLLLLNYLLSVAPNYLEFHIVDPNALGLKFTHLLDKQLQPFVHLHTSDVQKVVDELKEVVTTNIRDCKDTDLDTYNRQSEELGKVTKSYHILVLVSGCKDLFEDKSFLSFLNYSYKYGVIIYYHSTTPVGPKYLESISETYPKELTPELINKVIDTFLITYKENKRSALDYVTQFRDKYLPKEKYWTYSTNSGIEINFGLEDGDPSKPFPIVMSDSNIHCLMGGMTGSGKSATINQTLSTLLLKYSPRELELIMVDFKNVEFSGYTENGISRVPHARIIAGTTDGEYAVSVFEYAFEEMQRRNRIFGQCNVKKLEEYNNKMREEGHPENTMPRMLVLIDEFQVMFTAVDDRCLDKITTLITNLSKLARSCGCHLWFTSQSMANTMSADILEQFSLRAALRCSKDTSTSLIGNPAAGLIKESKGYLITNNNIEQGESNNILWRVPYIPTPDLMETLDTINALSLSTGITGHKAVFYDEKTMYPAEVLLDKYKTIDINKYKRLFMLGERTCFSLNKAPVNFNFSMDDKENMIIGALDTADFLNLVMTCVDNIKAKNGKFILNCSDKDTYTLLGVDKLLPEQMVSISTASTPLKAILDILKSLIKSREQLPTSDLTPVYFICTNWEKRDDFSSDSHDYRTYDAFLKLVKTAPNYDIHFIFVCKDAKPIASEIISSCNHKICAKTDETTSYKILDTDKAMKLPDAFAIYQYTDKQQKFKIYQHVFTAELEEKEMVL